MRLSRTIHAVVSVIAASVVCAPAVAAPDAKTILIKMDTEMRRVLTSGKSYQATITKTIRAGSRKNETRVVLKLIPGKMLHADAVVTDSGKAGRPQHIVAADNGKAVTVYIVSSKSATIQPSNIMSSTLFVASMAGLPMNVGANLRIATAAITGSTKADGKPAYVILVKPLKPGMGGLVPTQYTIDKATYRLRKVASHEGSRETTLTISNEAVDKPIPASAFRVSIPAGVKIKDSRPGKGPGGIAPLRR